MLNDKDICDFIFDDLKGQLKSSKLNTFEKPQRILLTHREMTVENDTMTPTFKVRRNFAVKYFNNEINDLYNENLTTLQLRQVI